MAADPPGALQMPPQVTIVLFQGAAHAINFSHPRELAHAIRQFVAGEPIGMSAAHDQASGAAAASPGVTCTSHMRRNAAAQAGTRHLGVNWGLNVPVGKTVMVVEDDEEIRLVLRYALEDEGTASSRRRSGEAALILGQEPGSGRPAGGPAAARHPRLRRVRVGPRHRPGPDHRASPPRPTATTSSPAWRRAPTTTSTKPFVTKELMARIRAQIRRASDRLDDGSAGVRYEVAGSTGHGEVEAGTRIVPLSPTECSCCRAHRAARSGWSAATSCCRNVWGYRNSRRRTGGRQPRVPAARQDERDPAEPAHLQTVRGFGYRLKA